MKTFPTANEWVFPGEWTRPLNAWTSPGTLASQCQEAVFGQPELKARQDEIHNESLRLRIAILTYYYASGVYSSREIHQRLLHCRATHRLFEANSPDGADLARVREENRKVILASLIATLELNFQPRNRRFYQRATEFVRKGKENGAEFKNLVVEEAERRLAMAERLDACDFGMNNSRWGIDGAERSITA